MLRKSILGFLLLAVLSVSAQVSSPYTRYGLGSQFDHFNADVAGMAGIGNAYTSDASLNYKNPAALSHLRLTSLQVSGTITSNRISIGDTSFQATDGAFNSLMLAFPIISNYWGGGFGIHPLSYVDYGHQISVTDPLTGREQNQLFTGGGQMYRTFLSQGAKFKNYSFGLSAEFIFGTQRHFKFIDNLSSTELNFLRTEEMIIRDFNYTLGFQYRNGFKRKDENNLKTPVTYTIGVRGSAPQNITMKYTRDWSAISPVTQDSVENYVDFGEEFRQPRDLVLPLKLGAGIMFEQGSKWKAGVDVDFEQWSSFENAARKNFSDLTDRLRVSVGAEVVPDTAGKSAFRRARIRVGGYYEQTELQVAGQQILKYGTTFGLGLPVRRSFSMIDLSVDASIRGTTENDLARETLITFRVGLTLSDRWFQRRNYE